MANESKGVHYGNPVNHPYYYVILELFVLIGFPFEISKKTKFELDLARPTGKCYSQVKFEIVEKAG